MALAYSEPEAQRKVEPTGRPVNDADLVLLHLRSQLLVNELDLQPGPPFLEGLDRVPAAYGGGPYVSPRRAERRHENIGRCLGRHRRI